MKRWLPAILWMAAIFVVSHQPSAQLPGFGLFDLLVKKGAHFLAYAILAWLVQRAWPSGAASWGWALLITAVYAISDEFHQTFVPGRSGTLADVLIDISGGLTALLLAHYRSSVYGLQLTNYQAPGEVQSAQTVPSDEPKPPGV